MNSDQIFKVAKILERGTYGSFFSAIGCALQLADSDNEKRLVEAFEDKFQRVYDNAVEADRVENS